MPGLGGTAAVRQTARDKLQSWRDSKRKGKQPEIQQDNNDTTARNATWFQLDDLLRDAVLLLQGFDAKHARFYDGRASTSTRNSRRPPLERYDQADEDFAPGQLVFTERQGEYISQAKKDVLSQLAKLGWSYRQIQHGIASTSANNGAGLTESALCHCLQEHLREYDQLIGDLETRRNHSVTAEDDELKPQAGPSKESLPVIDSPDLGLTLQRLFVHIQDFELRIRMMSTLIDACRTLRGGALLSFIHSYTTDGAPSVASFCSSLLTRVSEPFFDSLACWIYTGQLVDPGHEFFVERKTMDGGNEEEGHRDMDGAARRQHWSGRYQLRQEMLPTFVSREFGNKIFSTGRSLNYISFACADASWVSAQQQDGPLSPTSLTHSITSQPSPALSSDTPQKLRYNDIAGLERSIDAAYSAASRRLFEIFFDKFGLLRHLRAIKDYLLLGRGDFVDLLMENMSTSLSKPANNLYRHTLTATLESSVRGSSSSSDHPDVLRRLDARMLEYQHGEIGWEVYTLEYKIDAPVNVVLDEDSMNSYTKLFTHLWKIKRCEFSLNESWKKVTNGARWWRKVADIQSDFHMVRLALQEMLHFIRQLQHYSHLEIIDCSWKTLEDFALRKQGDLDSLIEAHRAYLERLINKGLLRGSGAKQSDDILKQVREAFRLILLFKESVDALCNYALGEASRLDTELNPSRGIRTPTSRSSTPLPPLPPPDPEQLASLRRRISRYSSQFHELVIVIATSLAAHSDQDLRFLSIRLNFSLFYLVGKRDRK